jgi:hypothetical protein
MTVDYHIELYPEVCAEWFPDSLQGYQAAIRAHLTPIR